MPGEVGGVGGTELIRALDGVARGMAALQRPQLSVTVETPAAVTELLAQQVAIIERTLVPLVKVSVDNLRDAQAIGRHVTELVKLLREVDEKLRG